MFFSTDLLGRKSPLGVVWLVSHGKKVSKQKIMKIKVDDMCNMLLEPEVPHALRLQGILCAGVTLVFSRQQSYLLHDCQETMKKLMHLMMPMRSELTMLPEGKEAAKTQAITLDLSRLPLDEALMLRPMPGSNEATGIGGQDELFYVDWDVEARSLQQAPLEGYQQTYLLHGNEGWQIPERRPVLEDPLMVESTMPMVQVEPETFQVPPNMEEDEEFNRALMPELDAPLSLTPGDQQLTLPEGGKEEAHRGEIGSDPVGLSPAAISRQEEQPTKGEENEVEKGKQDLGEQKRNEPNIQYEALQSDKGRLRKRKQPESQTSPPPQDLDVLIRTHLYREWQQSHDDLVVEDRSLGKRREVAVARAGSTTVSTARLLLMPATKGFWRNPALLGLFKPCSSSGENAQDKTDERKGEGMTGTADVMLQAPKEMMIPESQMSDSVTLQQHLVDEVFHEQMMPGLQNIAAKVEAGVIQHGIELEGQGSFGHMGVLRETSAAARRLSAAQPGTSSDVESEHLRGLGSTPGTASFHQQGSISPGLAVGAAAFMQGQPQNGRPSHASLGDTTSAGMMEHVPELVIQSPIRLPRFQGLMETPGGIGSRDDSGGVLPSLPGSSGQKHLQVLDQTSEGDVFSNEQPQLPVDTQETSWHPVKIPEASDFTEETWQCIYDLRDAFLAQKGAATLSLFGLTTGLTRQQAAKFFFQVQVMLSLGYVEAKQEHPYRDIKLTCGPSMKLHDA